MAVNKKPPNLAENWRRKPTPCKVKNKNWDNSAPKWGTSDLQTLKSLPAKQGSEIDESIKNLFTQCETEEENQILERGLY